jgi:hypothetical protein
VEASLAPDFAEPIEGWRLWHLTEDAGTILLRSVIMNVVWPLRSALEAECLRTGRRALRRIARRKHVTPEFDCTCGVYAGRQELVPHYWQESAGRWSKARVFGRVALWGKVVECERGWRATRAYPSRIYVPADTRLGSADEVEIAAQLTEYGVPVELLPLPSVHAVEIVGAR